MERRATIKSIAEDLGISHMTVSRALSDSPAVRSETREAVRKRAKELGYVKSAAAMAMRGDGTQIVGLLLPNIVNEFYARFANTMALQCETHSLQLIIHLTNDDVLFEELALARLCEVQAFAVVMVPSPGQPDDEGGLYRDMRVIQLIRERTSDVPSDVISVNDAPAIGKAVAHLAAQGHTKIGFIGADTSLSSGRGRLAAFENGLAQFEIDRTPDLIKMGPPSYAMGQDAMGKLLTEGLASAVVCGGFEISNGALSTHIAGSTSKAERPRFIGYGDPMFYAWVEGGLSTIRVPVDDLASKAVQLIVRSNGPGKIQRVTSDAEFILR